MTGTIATARILAVGEPGGPLGALIDALQPRAALIELGESVGVLDRESWDLVILDASAPHVAYYRETWPWTLVEAPDVFVPSLVLFEPGDPAWIQGDVYAKRTRPTHELLEIAERLIVETTSARLVRMEPRVPATLDPLLTYSAQELRKLTTMGSSILGMLLAVTGEAPTELELSGLSGSGSGDNEEMVDGLQAVRGLLQRIEHIARSQINHARRSRLPVVSIDLADTLTFALSRLGERTAHVSIPENLALVEANSGVLAIVLASVLAGHGRHPGAAARASRPGTGRHDTEETPLHLPLEVAAIRNLDEASVTLRLQIPKSIDDPEPVLTDDDKSPIPVVSAWSWELLLHGIGARVLPAEWKDDDELPGDGPAHFAVTLRHAKRSS